MGDEPNVAVPASNALPDSFWTRTWKLLAIFLPGPFKEAYKQGLLFLLATIVLGLVVFPLLIAFLASLWLTMAKQSQFEPLNALQRTYVAQIHQGFGMNELVTNEAHSQNARIDYIIPIDLTLDRSDPKNLNSGVGNIKIRLQWGQFAELRLTDVTVEPPSQPCPFTLPPRPADVLKATLGADQLVSCPQTQNGECSMSLSAEWWNKEGNSFKKGSDIAQLTTLTFKPTAAIPESCGALHVEGTLAIFKEVVPAPVTSKVASAH